MNSLNSNQKKQLTINIGLMALTLLTLVFCVFAWFASVTNATVKDITMGVERADIQLRSEITKIDFPCATKLSSFTASTKDEFLNECIVPKTYILSGEGTLHTRVECNGTGMLAYVCNETSGDFYAEMIDSISEVIGTTQEEWTYEELKSALDEINSRRVGTPITFEGEKCTEIRIIYWVEYTDDTEQLLTNPEYWESQYDTEAKKYEYYSEITFTI